MSPESITKRKRKKTLADWLRALIAGLIPTIAVGVWVFWGDSQNVSGANGEKLNNVEKRMDKVDVNLEVADKKTAEWKADVGATLNSINNKLDTVIDFQKKQAKFNTRMAYGNEKLTRSLEDIFNLTRQSYIIADEEYTGPTGGLGGTR